MDLLAAREDLAANITTFDAATADGFQVSEHDIHRWQKLFSLTHEEASTTIKNWRSDLNRATLSHEVWLSIKDAKMHEGHDKESYEWSMSQFSSGAPRQTQPRSVSASSRNKMTLLKLDGTVFSTASKVQALANLERVPVTIPGTDDDDKPVRFCLLDSHENALLTQALATLSPRQQPTRISVSIASKDLSKDSECPTLGVDTTLPHLRPCHENSRQYLPTQDEFPVWYFFYGTLAEHDKLSRVLGYRQDSD